MIKQMFEILHQIKDGTLFDAEIAGLKVDECLTQWDYIERELNEVMVKSVEKMLTRELDAWDRSEEWIKNSPETYPTINDIDGYQFGCPEFRGVISDGDSCVYRGRDAGVFPDCCVGCQYDESVTTGGV